MREFVFNRKDYKSYKNMYEDLAVKLGRINGEEDYYDISNFDYDSNCLFENLMYGFDNIRDNKFIFLNFDKQKIALQKNFDDYKYNIIIEVFEDFVKNYPNNQLEFRMED